MPKGIGYPPTSAMTTKIKDRTSQIPAAMAQATVTRGASPTGKRKKTGKEKLPVGRKMNKTLNDGMNLIRQV